MVAKTMPRTANFETWRLKFFNHNGRKSVGDAKNSREMLEAALRGNVTKIAFEQADPVRGNVRTKIEADRHIFTPDTYLQFLSPDLRVTSMGFENGVEIATSAGALDALLTGCVYDGVMAVVLARMLGGTDAAIFLKQGLPPGWKMEFGTYRYAAGKMNLAPDAKLPDFIESILIGKIAGFQKN